MIDENVYPTPSQHHVEMTPPHYIIGLAFLADLLLIYLILLTPLEQLLIRYIPDGAQWSMTSLPLPDGLYLIIAGTTGLLLLLYFSLFEYYLGRTPGMRLLGITTKGIDNVWTSFVRNMFVIPIFPFTILLLIDGLYLLFRKQRLLERFTGTSTVQVMSYV